MSLLLGHRYTHETISAITDQVLKGAETFAQRPLPEEMAIVYLDGLFLKVLREGLGVEKAAVYVALGVTPSGSRQILGFWLLPTENAHAWEGVLRELWRRGLRRVLLFVTDGLPGIEGHAIAYLAAIRRVYPLAQWQRCVVHQVRASLSQVRSQDRALLAQDLRGVYMAGSRKEALEALGKLRAVWGSRYPSLVASWWESSGALLRFYEYPQVLWPYLRSTNLMERFIREVRRGTKVRDHKFPRPEAVCKIRASPVTKLLYLGQPRRGYLVVERQEGRWAERRVKIAPTGLTKGFAEVREVLEEMLQERYAPHTQTSTHKS